MHSKDSQGPIIIDDLGGGSGMGNIHRWDLKMLRLLTSTLVLFVVLLPSVGAEEVPNLVGNWSGVGSGAIYEIRDILPGDPENLSYGNALINLTIEEQNGRMFVGKMIPPEHPDEIETILGVILPNNETFYMVDENGHIEGRLISANEMMVVYREVGPNGMRIALNMLTRA